MRRYAGGNSVEIGAERRPDVVGHGWNRNPVILVIDTGRNPGARFQRRNHGVVEFEPQKVHGRGFLIIGTLEILVRDREDAVVPVYLHVNALFDAEPSKELRKDQLKKA